MKKEPEIAIVIGTRAELIKTFPIMVELQKEKIPYYLIHTGQHNLKDLCEKFSVKNPDFVLTKEPEKSSKFYAQAAKAILWNAGLVFKIRAKLKKMKSLRYVLYHGDTMTTLSVAIASSKILNPFKRYKNIHLEAGLRSENLSEPFPEEISRIIADWSSDILFAVSERSQKNLSRYIGKKKISITGNTIIDSVNLAYNLSIKRKIKPLSNKKFVLISIHRHENIKSRERLLKIIEILSRIDIESYFPLHDNTRKQILKFGFYEKLTRNKNINIVDPIDYVNFIYQLKNCSLIICDGGSLQEESLIFKKPCIILRMATERQEGLGANFQFLSMLNVEKTVEKISEFLGKGFKIENFINPYENKKGTSKEIVRMLKNELEN